MEKFYVQETIEVGNKHQALRVLMKSAYSILMIIVTTVEALLLSLVKMSYKWITCKITKK